MRFWLASAMLLIGSNVSAQAITGVQIVITGGISPVTNVIPIANWQCGQPPSTVPAGTITNPIVIEYTDPTDATKVCRFRDTGTGPLTTLPFGGTVYTMTATFVNTAGNGPTSAPSNPFAHPGSAPTTAPQGVKVAP